MNTFYALKIKDITPQTKDAVAVTFEIPDALASQFVYKPGQYITVRFIIDGKEVRRSYSICSKPNGGKSIQIGVKKVYKGLVSNHINSQLQQGDYVEVMPPSGRFFATIHPTNYKTHYLFAAGSGITPMLSILKTVLSTEVNSYVYLLYGNRDQDSILFESELNQLINTYADRFFVSYIFSKPKSSWSDLWSSSSKNNYQKGRIDASTIVNFINEYPPYAQDTAYYICGPGNMIQTTQETLVTIDVPLNRIYVESFGQGEATSTVQGIIKASLEARLYQKNITVTVKENTTLLRALLNENHEPPFSCEGGVCGSCKCKLKQGKVHMKTNLALDTSEVNAGYILSCQSIPLTPVVQIDFEN